MSAHHIQEQRWIKGPLFAGVPLDDVIRYGIPWRNGFSGPYTLNESRRLSGLVPKCKVLTREQFSEVDPDQIRAESVIAGKLLKMESRFKKSKQRVEDLQTELASRIVHKDDEDIVGALGKDLDNLARVRARKAVMKRVGFKQSAFAKHGLAWSHFAGNVLPYIYAD